MKYLGVVFGVLVFAGLAWGGGDDVKIIRMHGQVYKIWTDDKGVRRIDPVYILNKGENEKRQRPKTTQEKAEAAKVPEQADEVDPAAGTTVVEPMDYDTCRASLTAAQAMATSYNVVFDHAKSEKFTVLMVVDDKTVQLKCEYGTRVTTTWQ